MKIPIYHIKAVFEDVPVHLAIKILVENKLSADKLPQPLDYLRLVSFNHHHQQVNPLPHIVPEVLFRRLVDGVVQLVVALKLLLLQVVEI